MVSTERTKDELQEELRRRGLPVSGTKDELVARLAETGATPDGARARDDGSSTGGSSAGRGAPAATGTREPAAGEVARRAAEHLAMLTRRPVEGISAIAREEQGWRVEVEVVEVSRVPSSTDVLGTYAVWVDGAGELLGYERVERFVRGRPGGEEG